MSNEDPNLWFGTHPGVCFWEKESNEGIKGNMEMIQRLSAALITHELSLCVR